MINSTSNTTGLLNVSFTTQSTPTNPTTTSLSNTTKTPAALSTVPPALLHYRSQATIIIQVALLAALGVIIVLGNLTSVVTFLKTQSLRRRCHYLLISLSIADLMVGFNSFMTMYFFLTGPQFNLFIVTLEFIDTFTGTASILTLSVIAVERFYAIYFPFKHRMLRFKFYMACIGLPWIIAALVASLFFISYFGKNASVYEVYTYHIFIVAWLALAVILTCYISIGLKIKQSNPSAQNQSRVLREKRLAVTLLIVTLASLLTWIPLQCFLFVLHLCKRCPFPHFNVLFIMKFLQYCNSGINVFIYIIRMPEFRKAFWVMLCNKDADNAHVTKTSALLSTRSGASTSTIDSQTRQILRNKDSPSTHALVRESSSTLNTKLNIDENIGQRDKMLANSVEERGNPNQKKIKTKKKIENTTIEEGNETQRDFKTGMSNAGFTTDTTDTRL